MTRSWNSPASPCGHSKRSPDLGIPPPISAPTLAVGADPQPVLQALEAAPSDHPFLLRAEAEAVPGWTVDVSYRADIAGAADVGTSPGMGAMSAMGFRRESKATLCGV